MFKSKSFDLVNEERDNKLEKLYQPRRLSWLKYIVIPALVGFILMLILFNVDFSNETPEYPIDALSTETVTETMKETVTEIDITTNAMSTASNIATISASIQFRQTHSKVWCELNTSSKCNLTCSKSEIGLKSELEFYQSQCDGSLMLRLEHIEFPSGCMNTNVFVGDYSLQSLVIVDSYLSDIAVSAFSQDSLRNLSSLELINTQLQNLDADVFYGLSNLRNFTLINSCFSFNGNDFLVPLADTLERALIKHQSWGGVVTAPSTWFGNASYAQLKVLDLRGSDLEDHLPAVESRWTTTTPETTELLDIRAALEEWTAPHISVKPTQSASTALPDTSTGLEENTTEITTTEIQTTETGHWTAPHISASTTTPAITELPQTSPITYTVNTTIETEVPAPPTLFAELICVSAGREQLQTRDLPYDALIRVEDKSNSEVRVVLSMMQLQNREAETTWYLFYLQDNFLVGPLVFDVLANESGRDADDATVHVEHLSCATAYIFCLVLTENVTAPHNCRAHRTAYCDDTGNNTWFERHCGLIIGLGILGILLCVAAGILSTWGTLRLRPSWLRGSTRLVRPTRDCQKMLLLPRSDEKAEYGIRSPNSVGNNCEYISYYRQLEQSKLYQAEPNRNNAPPRDRAPSVPPSSERSSQATEISMSPSSYIYESLELYEELF